MNSFKKFIWKLNGSPVEYLKIEDVIHIEDFYLLEKIRDNNRDEEVRQLADYKLQIIRQVTEEKNIEKLYNLVKENNYGEDFFTIFKKISFYNQFNIVKALDEESVLKQIVMGNFDFDLQGVALNRINDVSLLIKIITLNPWNNSSLGCVGILRLLDFETTNEILTFLNNTINEGNFDPKIKKIAQILLKYPQYAREVKANSFYSSCENEPRKWVVNFISMIRM